MTRAATKKAAVKKTATGSRPQKNDDPLEVVREDTPNPELTDLDRAKPSCSYCGRNAVGRLPADPRRGQKGALVCEQHAARAETNGREVGKL